MAKSRVNPRLMLILGVVGTYLTTSLVATSLENRIADQLVHSEDAALDAAVQLQGRQVAAIRLIANIEGIDRAVSAGDAAALRQLIIPLEVNNRLGTVMIFDASGRTILEIRQPDPTSPNGLVFASGTDLSTEPEVLPVLLGQYDSLGDKYIGYRGSPPSALAAAGPVVLADRVVGGVLVETPLATTRPMMDAIAEIAARSKIVVEVGENYGRRPVEVLNRQAVEAGPREIAERR